MDHIKAKEDFQHSEIVLRTLPKSPESGKCLIIEVPNGRGGTHLGTLMWEAEEEAIKKQVKDLCEKYNPHRVLEIGFGLGYTATQFQECGVTKHVIVEAHPQMVADANLWRTNYPHKDIEIVHSFIQDFIYEEEDYDLIYDDRYEMVYGETTSREYFKERGFVWNPPTIMHPSHIPCWKIIGDNRKKQ